MQLNVVCSGGHVEFGSTSDESAQDVVDAWNRASMKEPDEIPTAELRKVRIPKRILSLLMDGYGDEILSRLRDLEPSLLLT